MKEDSLLYFETPYKLRSFVNSLDIYNGWKIQSGIMNDRGKQIDGKSYTIKLRQLFRDKEFFRRNVSLAEIISWLDNIILISRVLDELEREIPINQFKKIKIIAEYRIKMSKNMRIDYVFIYKDNILLVELRTVNRFERLKSSWDKKFQELIVYKELINNYIFNMNIRLYAFIALFEYEEGKKKDKHIEYNNNQIKYISKYIKKFIISEITKK